ncbi:MAG: ATP-dependent sacrificial sulfur transferase LarE [Pseudomonadota bacterium]
MSDALQRLESILRDMDGAAVAFSGGRDSALLLAAAARALPAQRVVAFIGVSPLLPGRERDAALTVAAQIGVEVMEFYTDPLVDPGVVANEPDRCYHCKRALLLRFNEEARCRGLTLVEGSQRDDDPGDRPGARALRELGVRSPLREAGLGGPEITEISRHLGLSTADRPSESCLATRVPAGTPLDAALLARIEAAEDTLVAAGFAGCRARHHGDLLRVEIAVADIPRLLRVRLRTEILEELRTLGWRHVTLDLAGYRSGSHAAPAREDA